MHRWHGLVGENADTDAARINAYRVTLHGVPFDERDHAQIHARLSDARWSAEQVRHALVLGASIGRGQLWQPDPLARVEVLLAECRAGTALLHSLTLAVDSALEAADLEQRLAQLFAEDRLIEAVVEPLGE